MCLGHSYNVLSPQIYVDFVHVVNSMYYCKFGMNQWYFDLILCKFYGNSNFFTMYKNLGVVFS